MGVQPIPTTVCGPLPEGTVGLLLGRSSSALKGSQITPGVIDPDFTGEIKILASSPQGIVSISLGDLHSAIANSAQPSFTFPGQQ